LLITGAIVPRIRNVHARCLFPARSCHLACRLLCRFTVFAQVARAPGARFAEMAAIDQAVAQFTGHPIGVPGGAAQPIDRRLRLAACTAPLALGCNAGRRA
jgi:flagella basal body P-ring formation protein FlgA